MKGTLKVVLFIPSLNERFVWYVSNEGEARRMVTEQMCYKGRQRWRKYRDLEEGKDYTVIISHIFGGDGSDGVSTDHLKA